MLCCLMGSRVPTSLPGRKSIYVRTEHSALRRILHLTYVNGKLAQTHLRLSKYKFDIIHWSGVEHQAGNVLSWLETMALKIAEMTTISRSWPSNKTYVSHPTRNRTISFVSYVMTMSIYYQPPIALAERPQISKTSHRPYKNVWTKFDGGLL